MYCAADKAAEDKPRNVVHSSSEELFVVMRMNVAKAENPLEMMKGLRTAYSGSEWKSVHSHVRDDNGS